MSQALKKDSFLAPRTRKTQPVEVQELGGHVYVRELYGDEFDRFSKSLQDKRGKVDQSGLAARMLVACLSDAEGKALFEPAEVAQLNKSLPVSVLLRLTKAASEFNGLDEDDEAELLGNSETTTPNDSGTA